jgi:hypothetical protein
VVACARPTTPPRVSRGYLVRFGVLSTSIPRTPFLPCFWRDPRQSGRDPAGMLWLSVTLPGVAAPAVPTSSGMLSVGSPFYGYPWGGATTCAC